MLPPRSRSQAGFTLIELLIALTLLGFITAAVVTVSITGTMNITDKAVEQHLDPTAAQLVATAFARDVQGASKLSSTSCSNTAGSGTALVTFVSSDDNSLTSYRDLSTSSG